MAFSMEADRDVQKQLCDALGLEPAGVRRIILDIQVNCFTMAYVEMYASSKILEIDWAQLRPQVTILDKVT